jgi:hypothetical protein
MKSWHSSLTMPRTPPLQPSKNLTTPLANTVGTTVTTCPPMHSFSCSWMGVYLEYQNLLTLSSAGPKQNNDIVEYSSFFSFLCLEKNKKAERFSSAFFSIISRQRIFLTRMLWF